MIKFRAFSFFDRSEYWMYQKSFQTDEKQFRQESVKFKPDADLKTIFEKQHGTQKTVLSIIW